MMILCLTIAASWGQAAPAVGAEQDRGGTSIAEIVDEAATRFRLPAKWIFAVISAESGGDARALSPKGAMGLMQLMPPTWRAQRAQYALGEDPFDRRDNVLAGTAYLRELYDRFGAEGFLAAYNAGPSRYADAQAGRRRLPLETVAYVARVERSIGVGDAVEPAIKIDWRAAGLFVERGGDAGQDGSTAREPVSSVGPRP
jgi:soluble lytic murein transglycosylase-like protein